MGELLGGRLLAKSDAGTRPPVTRLPNLKAGPIGAAAIERRRGQRNTQRRTYHAGRVGKTGLDCTRYGATGLETTARHSFHQGETMNDETKPELKILPTHGPCEFMMGLDAAGKPRRCGRDATMRILNQAPRDLCDRHAAMTMEAECGRSVEIKRQLQGD